MTTHLHTWCLAATLSSMDFTKFGFIRVAAIAPGVVLANPKKNASLLCNIYDDARQRDASIIVTPELSLTGYSCEDLFHTSDLLESTRIALKTISRHTQQNILIVGAPWQLTDGRLLNCAFVCTNGKIVGAVPKTAHPNYGEFYEQRWFSSGGDVVVQIADRELGSFPLARDQLFAIPNSHGDEIFFGIEICEDLWSPRSPSSEHAIAGATIIINPSASTELIAKADYRRELVKMQSAKTLSAYIYAGSGSSESTKDVVYGGHLLAAENGVLQAQSERFTLSTSSIFCDIDIAKLRHERLINTTFNQLPRTMNYVTTPTSESVPINAINKEYSMRPFVPRQSEELVDRASEILAIQTTGLARRMASIDCSQLVIGLSGGLDSTLALLVCLETADRLNLPLTAIYAITMPGPGTTEHTLETVRALAETTKIPLQEIPIHAAVEQHLEDLEHTGEPDITFENTQARERTQLLFDTANMRKGLVVGTGDLSELALGWCTFNADHMSNYNVNVSVPKTLISYLVQWYADHKASETLKKVLIRVLETPITPELIPTKTGQISQVTEDIIGPYELHDFFLYHMIRTGASVEKIFILAGLAFADKFSSEEIKKWLGVFIQRFYQQQFKRTTLPPGPKVGTVSLSPRGDWRMPDEVNVSTLLDAVSNISTD